MNIKVNQEKYTLEVNPNKPLLWVLREDLKLLGSKYSCGVGLCGACTVLVDGVATRSCVFPINQVAEGQTITTIEGLNDQLGTQLKDAWCKHNVSQCGYCQAGQIVACHSLIAQQNISSELNIVDQMTNLCRCGTYPRIRKAITEVVNTRKDEE